MTDKVCNGCPTSVKSAVATVRRRYRPADDATTRDAWATRLDIRELRGGILHCNEAKVRELRDELVAEDLGGDLALSRNSRADRFEGKKVVRPEGCRPTG